MQQSTSLSTAQWNIRGPRPSQVYGLILANIGWDQWRWFQSGAYVPTCGGVDDDLEVLDICLDVLSDIQLLLTVVGPMRTETQRPICLISPTLIPDTWENPPPHAPPRLAPPRPAPPRLAPPGLITNLVWDGKLLTATAHNWMWPTQMRHTAFWSNCGNQHSREERLTGLNKWSSTIKVCQRFTRLSYILPARGLLLKLT